MVPATENNQGPVVQSIVILTSSLRGQVVIKCLYDFIIKYTDIFFVEINERSFCTAKASHIFSTKILEYLRNYN